jgi:hypothetical protein
MFPRNPNRSIVVGVAAIAVAGGAYGIVSATSSSGSAATASKTVPACISSGGGGSNTRSGPAAGGAAGTVSTVTSSGFTMSTPAGQKVTVDEAAATAYKDGASSTTADAVTTGQSVLVLGRTSGTSIKATQVVVKPSGSSGSANSATAKVVPFARGTETTTKQTGQVPANYTEGSGTIVSGTAANQATEDALAAYPGGIVDRVVKLSNGEYEVHNIGVNWPHHIFVNDDFKVVGAE